MLSSDGLAFVHERVLATLTTLRRGGGPHVTAVGFTWDDNTDIASGSGLVRVICSGGSQKAINARRDPRVAICQLDGARWVSLEGHAEVSDDPERVAEAVRRYAQRYRPPRENPRRVAIEITVRRILGSSGLVQR